MKPNKKLLIAAGVSLPLFAIAWSLFRPELLFVNQVVNEKLPVSAGAGTTQAVASKVYATGSLTSQAHETKGMVEVVETGGKTYVQIRDFHTSNGPDVHLYLVKGNSADAGKVLSNGFIDLGPIKGNIGDQAYEVPAGTDLSEYGAVSVWCQRFSVGFGGAELARAPEMKMLSASANRGHRQSQPTWQLVSFESPVEVTFGSFKGNKDFSGRAALIEEEGKRFVDLNIKKMGSGEFKLRLVKKETLSVGSFPSTAKFVELGKAAKKHYKVQISKDLDIWLFRSIAVLDKDGKVISFVNLRSEQEGKGGQIFF